VKIKSLKRSKVWRIGKILLNQQVDPRLVDRLAGLGIFNASAQRQAEVGVRSARDTGDEAFCAIAAHQAARAAPSVVRAEREPAGPLRQVPNRFAGTWARNLAINDSLAGCGLEKIESLLEMGVTEEFVGCAPGGDDRCDESVAEHDQFDKHCLHERWWKNECRRQF